MIMSPQEIWDRVNQYVVLLNEHGPEGEESKKFVERQEAYDELLEALESIRELAVAHGVGPQEKPPLCQKE